MTPTEWEEQQDREQAEYLREWSIKHPWRAKRWRLAGLIDLLVWIAAMLLLVGIWRAR